MHKCFKCGTEFEGRFCPECGTEWKENKVCPQCGATLAGNVKFCNQCGYAFAEQEKPKEKKDNKFVLGLKKFGAWLKKHLKVVIPVTAAALVLIVICSLIPTFIVASVNGTYYRLTLDGEFVNEDFITLSTGKWTDGKTKGTYALKGGAITVKADIEKVSGTEDWGDLGDLVGDLEQEASTRKGEIKNGVIKFTDTMRTEIYCKKNHKHKYGKWETVTEPTCTAEGSQKHSCFCGYTAYSAIPLTGHILNDDFICLHCGKAFTKGLEFTQKKNGYILTGVGTAFGDVIIPETYEGKPVTSIENKAFYDCKGLTSVIIPDSVTTIGNSAFANCSGLTSITLGKGVTSIGQGAFFGCSGLTSVHITDIAAWCQIFFDGTYANPLDYAHNLYQNNSLITELVIPNGTTTISAFAFYECINLTSVVIPDSVSTIGNSVFSGCIGIKSANIPLLALKAIPTDNLTNVTITSGDLIKDYAFEGYSSLTSVTISNSVTSIGSSAFSGCSGLTSITIPDSVTSIGSYAFYDCSGLTSITIPDGVTSIKDSAFSGCSGLTSVTIPDSVTSIEDSAFKGCSGLTSITIPDSVTSIGSNAFYYCSSLTNIIFKGTKAEWEAIKKRSGWNYNAGSYTVKCTDGDTK